MSQLSLTGAQFLMEYIENSLDADTTYGWFVIIDTDLIASIIESMPCLLKYLKLDSTTAMIQVDKEFLEFLFRRSLKFVPQFLTMGRQPQPGVSYAVLKVCIEQIQLLLAKRKIRTHDLGSYFMSLLSTCFIHEYPENLFRELLEREKPLSDLYNLIRMETELSKKVTNLSTEFDASKLCELRHLLMQLLLQLLLEKLIRPGEFPISTFISCCQKAIDPPLPASISGKDKSDTPELIDVLIYTLVLSLRQSSAPLRYAVEQVFKHFCNDMTKDGLDRMLGVIKKDLADITDQDEEIEAEARGTGDSEGQIDDSVKSCEDVCDEMFRMEAYVTQIFKEEKKLAGSETAQSQLVVFKLEVLSLLEIYLHKNPSKPEVLWVYSNLAKAYANLQSTEITGQLGQGIWGVLHNKIFKAKQFPTIDIDLAVSLLGKVASDPFKGNRTVIDAQKKKLADESTIWVVKMIDAQKWSKSELQKIFDILEALLTKFFESEESLINPEFLRELFRRCEWAGHHLLRLLLEKCGASNSFRRVEALELVIEILKGTTYESNNDASMKVLNTNLHQLSDLVMELVSEMPERESRWAKNIQEFCSMVFQIVSTHDLKKIFLQGISPKSQAALESQLGDLFLDFKNAEI